MLTVIITQDPHAEDTEDIPARTLQRELPNEGAAVDWFIATVLDFTSEDISGQTLTKQADGTFRHDRLGWSMRIDDGQPPAPAPA